MDYGLFYRHAFPSHFEIIVHPVIVSESSSARLATKP